MARIRTIKPEFFLHDILFDLEKETGLPLRLAYIGLWTQCDREGRFKWRPLRLKVAVLPYDDVDMSRVLDALITRGFVVKYNIAGVEYGVIPSFKKHQVINNRESESDLPAPEPINSDKPSNDGEFDASGTREGRADDAFSGEGKGKEGKGKEGKGNNTHGDEPPCPDKLPSKYEFEGQVIKLTRKAYDDWKGIYPDIDLTRELKRIDQELVSNPQKNWFISTSQKLNYQQNLMAARIPKNKLAISAPQASIPNGFLGGMNG